jgi:hypothetical protein
MRAINGPRAGGERLRQPGADGVGVTLPD